MGKEKSSRGRQRTPELCLWAFFLFAGIVLVWIVRMQPESGGQVVVSVGGQERERFSLYQEHTEEISGKNGGTNRLVIRGGEARIEDASCPDHLCVKEHAISRTGESIICLPNQVVVSIEDGEEEEVDGIAR